MPMNKPKLWTLNYVLVMISNFAAAFSHNCFTTVLALYINDIGGSNRIAGMVAGGLTLVMIITRPIFGHLIDRIGRRPIAVLGAILFALNTIAYNFAYTMTILIVIRVLHGLSQGMFTVSTSTLVADIIPEERLTEGLGFFGVSSNLSGVLGPIVGLSLYQGFGAQVLFLFMSVFASIGAVAAILIRLPAVARAERLHEQRSWSERMRSVPRFVVGLIEFSVILPGLIAMFDWFGYSSVQNFLTTCGTARGIPSVSLYFTVSSCAMIATRLLAGRISRLFNSATVIFFSLGLMAASFVVVAFANTLSVLIVAGLLYGLGSGLAEPILQTLVFQLCPLSRRGAANATYGLIRDIGGGLGSTVWGSVTMSAGYTVTYLLSAACVGVSVLIHTFFLRPKMKRMKSMAEQE